MTLVTGFADPVRPQAPVAAVVAAVGLTGADALGATDPLGPADADRPAAPGAEASAATGSASADRGEGSLEHAPTVRARATAVAAVTHLILVFRIVLSIS